MAHCVSCHKKLGENPAEFIRHYIDLRGQGQLDLLTEQWRDTSIKIPKKEQALIAKHYRGEYKRIDGLRKDGQIGYIEVINYV